MSKDDYLPYSRGVDIAPYFKEKRMKVIITMKTGRVIEMDLEGTIPMNRPDLMSGPWVGNEEGMIAESSIEPIMPYKIAGVDD